MQNKMKKWIKIALKLIVSWAIVMLLIMYSWGWFTENAMLKDIVELKSFQVIASSENWELSSPYDFGYTPFLTYKGKGKVEKNIHVRGVISYGSYIHNGEKIMENIYKTDTSVVMDRHFFIGEKRWYFNSSYSKDIFQSACIKVTWKKNGTTYSE